VQLQHHRALREREAGVLVRQLDRHHLALGQAVPEAPLQRPGLRLVPDDVELLAGVGERALGQIVVVRREYDELRLAALAQQRGQAREQPVERGRRVIGVEDGPQVAVELPLAEGRIDVLRDA
jgi:hypothetical protein